MGKGKLQSSPFHVETAKYKYAIEHESDNYRGGNFVIQCQYLKTPTKRCMLWNSGRSKSCAQFGCKYLMLHEHLVELSCLQCAYCFERKCYFPKKPQDIEIRLSEATYCCYFLREKKDAKLFQRIRRYCARLFYTEQLDLCENDISVIEKRHETPSRENDIVDGILVDSISDDKNIAYQLEVLRIKQKELASQLNKVGGRLESMPKNIHNNKKKANKKC